MKEILIFILVIAAIGFIACTPKTKKVVEQPTEVKPAETTPPKGDVSQDEPAPAGKPAFGKATIRKTACYGNCPVFELTFDGAGKAYYKGKKHVKRIGKWEAPLSRTQIQSILAKAQSVYFFNFKDEYPTNGKIIADFPFTFTHMKFGLQEKTVANNHDAPDTLIDFETFLIELGESLNWEKVNESN